MGAIRSLLARGASSGTTITTDPAGLTPTVDVASSAAAASARDSNAAFKIVCVDSNVGGTAAASTRA